MKQGQFWGGGLVHRKKHLLLLMGCRQMYRKFRHKQGAKASDGGLFFSDSHLEVDSKLQRASRNMSSL